MSRLAFSARDGLGDGRQRIIRSHGFHVPLFSIRGVSVHQPPSGLSRRRFAGGSFCIVSYGTVYLLLLGVAFVCLHHGQAPCGNAPLAPYRYPRRFGPVTGPSLFVTSTAPSAFWSSSSPGHVERPSGGRCPLLLTSYAGGDRLDPDGLHDKPILQRRMPVRIGLDRYWSL